jgi:hypothetical protein
MGFKALTVNTAVEAAGHIYAEDDAAIFQSMFGGDGVLNIGNCLKSTVISNNKVRISDGVLSVGGHIGRLSHADYQDMTIENGATGYNRNDIIYARFLTSGNVDSFILAVKKGTATTGTATDPALVQGNLYEGAVERDYPLYRVKLSGLSISSVDQLFTVIPTIPDLKAQMEKDKAEINQSLGLLSEGIQAVSKKQNFCKGSDRLLTDVLIIDFKNPAGESNSYGVIATEDASKLLNSPVTDGAFYAYREVLTIKSASKDYKVIVRLTEAYPSPGRIWIRMYNPDTSNWSGWKVI